MVAEQVRTDVAETGSPGLLLVSSLEGPSRLAWRAHLRIPVSCAHGHSVCLGSLEEDLAFAVLEYRILHRDQADSNDWTLHSEDCPHCQQYGTTAGLSRQSCFALLPR